MATTDFYSRLEEVEEDDMCLATEASSACSLRLRAQERIAYLKTQSSTYTTPLHVDETREEDGREMRLFLTSFQEAISTPARRLAYRGALAQDPDLARLFETLVVRRKVVKYEDFWERYEYRCDVSRVISDLMQKDDDLVLVPTLKGTNSVLLNRKPPSFVVPKEILGHMSPWRDQDHSSIPDVCDSPFLIDLTVEARKSWGLSLDSSTGKDEEPDEAVPSCPLPASSSTRHEDRALEALTLALQAPGSDEISSDMRRFESTSVLPWNRKNDGLFMEPQNLNFHFDTHQDFGKMDQKSDWTFEHTPKASKEWTFERTPETVVAELLRDEDTTDGHKLEEDEPSRLLLRIGHRRLEAEDLALRLQAEARRNEQPEVEADDDEMYRRLEQANQLERVRLAQAMARLEAAYNKEGQQIHNDDEDDEVCPNMPIHTIETMDEEDDGHVGDLTISMEDFSFDDDSFDALLNSAQQVLQTVQGDEDTDWSYIETDSLIQHNPEEHKHRRSDSDISTYDWGATTHVNEELARQGWASTKRPSKSFSGKVRTSALFTVGVFLSLLASSVVVWIRSHERAGNILCAPAKPGSILSEATLADSNSLAATWWAPDGFKEATFSLLCPSRTRTEIQAVKSKQGHLRIDIVDTASKILLLSWDRLRFFEIDSEGDKIHADTPRGTRTLHIAPWSTKKETDTA